MQALLLRFLETGEIQRVGSDRRVPSLDVRVIAATHRRLIDLVAEKRFREDLYYRLNVVHINVPPLRDRRDDVLILAKYFVEQFAEAHRTETPEFTPEAFDYLANYRWPGNVRELRNVAERLVLRCRGAAIGVDALPREILAEARTPPTPAAIAATNALAPAALIERMLSGGSSFWSVVYEPFMARDLTRRDIREIVRIGLEQTRGNYKLLVTTFNMAPTDYKKFLNFLRKYQCHVPFQAFRMAQAYPSKAPAGAQDDEKLPAIA
jgi:DNA-binding NtrC family response regulator